MKSNFSSCPQHEKFEELAALAAVGEVSDLELEFLHRHIAGCSSCREAYEAFANVASNDLGLAAAKRESASGFSEPVGLGHEDDSEGIEHLLRLRKRLRSNESQLTYEASESITRASSGDGGDRGRVRPGNYRRRYGLAAMILLSLTVGGGAFLRMTKTISAERARSRELQSAVDSQKQRRGETPAADGAVLRSLQESQEARDALQKSLAASQARNGDLLAREKGAEEQLSAAIATAEQFRQKLEANNGDKERLAKLQQESDAKLHEALVELYEARQAGTETAMKPQASESASVALNEQASSPSASNMATPSEAEARNLFGARDLHIVDVYDVAGNGKTKRTYGRVYYVEKKLLVFYAFDLQNGHGRKQGTFQAWGYREANVGKALSLGLFAIDDSAMQRWVLTVNRPDVLSHIDAVFVTVEPPGGSTAPRGKKVLYANLIGPPNHP